MKRTRFPRKAEEKKKYPSTTREKKKKSIDLFRKDERGAGRECENIYGPICIQGISQGSVCMHGLLEHGNTVDVYDVEAWPWFASSEDASLNTRCVSKGTHTHKWEVSTDRASNQDFFSQACNIFYLFAFFSVFFSANVWETVELTQCVPLHRWLRAFWNNKDWMQPRSLFSKVHWWREFRKLAEIAAAKKKKKLLTQSIKKWED